MSRLKMVATLLIVLCGVAACTGTPPAASLTGSAGASVPPSDGLAPSAVGSGAASPSAATSPGGPAGASASGGPSRTTVDWGEIWDTLPVTFPRYPGAQPTVTGGGPASAILDVPADGPTASAWYQNALKAVGFVVIGANGPREDGSFDIVATKGSPDCQTEISLAPLGAATTATIYLAAACPFS